MEQEKKRRGRKASPTEEQMLQNRPQTRQKKEELSR